MHSVRPKMLFGNSAIKNIDDEVNHYQSTLCFGHHSFTSIEGVFEILWKNKRAYDSKSLKSVKTILEVALRNEDFKQSLAGLPPPTYQFARYTDWIEEFLEKYPTYSYTSSISFSSKDTLYSDAQELY